MTSPFQQAISSNWKSPVDERGWVIQIRRTIEEEPEEDQTDIPVSIFNVPKALMLSDPDSYIPQEVALGPYHHWRPELYEMERYKLAAAKRIQKQLQQLKFDHLVEHMMKIEPKIRASYHKYLNFNGETLAWMMAVDASFLLEFLQVCAAKEGRALKRISSRMSHLVDTAGTKSAHNAILRDMVMLENQIPLFLLRNMLEIQSASIQQADDMLISMLITVCKSLSPFKLMEDLLSLDVQVRDRTHLLDFLYHMIVPKPEELITAEVTEAGQVQDEEKEGEEQSFGNKSHVRKLADYFWKVLSKFNHGPGRIFKRVILSKPMKVAVKLPWKIISNLPGIKIFKGPIENLFFSQENEEEKGGEDDSEKASKPPLIEEIAIPSVTELAKAGVCFLPSNGGILSISFDEKTFTLYLPEVSLDINTEVTLRNLVAYEACDASGPLIIARYTEFMNGIIDTEEDSKFLREKGIISNRLKNDKEVADLWNGMSKSVRLTKVPFLDKVIKDVNKHHNARWKIKAGKFVKTYVFSSWKFLTLLAAIMILFMTFLQAFCSVYTCSKNFHFGDLEA